MASPTNTSGLKQGVVAPGTSITVAAGFTFTSGRQAVVAISKVSVGATTISGVTIAGTAATKYGSVSISNQQFEIWAVLGAGVSASNNNVVFTNSASDTFAVDFSVEEWPASTFTGDQSAAKNTSTGSTATPSVSSATSVTANAVVYSGYFPAASQTNNGMTGPSGWTQTFVQQNSTTSGGGIAGYHEETSSGTKTASYTRSGATNGGAVIVAFTETGGTTVTGDGAATAAPMTASGSGKRATSATGAATTAPMTASGSGVREIVGSGSASAAPMTADGLGTTTGGVIGTGASIAAPMTGSGSGKRGVSGSSAVANPPMSSAGTGTVSPAPPTVVLTDPLAYAGFRLRTIPDLAAGDVIQYELVSGSGSLVVNPNGSFVAAATVLFFRFRVDDGGGYGPWTLQEVQPAGVRPATRTRLPSMTASGSGTVS